MGQTGTSGLHFVWLWSTGLFEVYVGCLSLLNWASLLMHTGTGTWLLVLTNSSHAHVVRSWQLSSRAQTEREAEEGIQQLLIVMPFLRFKQTLFAYQLWATLPALRWTLRACSAWGSPLKLLTAPRWARTLSPRGITARWVRTSWWSCRRGPLR